MKKLILFVTIIAVVFSMASCKTFGADDTTVSEDGSTNTTSTEDTAGESSNGIIPDNNADEFPVFNDNSSEAEAEGGNSGTSGEDNEEVFNPMWNTTSGSSSTANDVEVNGEPGTTPEGEETEDPDGPGWIDGWY